MSKLQASGAISLSQIRNHFGGAAPDAISEYYRGGARVPNTSLNTNIPTSGAISLSDFYSGSNEQLLSTNITPTSVSGTGSESGSDPGTTPTVIAYTSGGSGNSFSWVQISGDPEIAISRPTSVSTEFFVDPIIRGHYTGVFKCTVTSADGQTASDTVEVTDINIRL